MKYIPCYQPDTIAFSLENSKFIVYFFGPIFLGIGIYLLFLAISMFQFNVILIVALLFFLGGGAFVSFGVLMLFGKHHIYICQPERTFVDIQGIEILGYDIVSTKKKFSLEEFNRLELIREEDDGMVSYKISLVSDDKKHYIFFWPSHETALEYAKTIVECGKIELVDKVIQ